MSPHRRKGLLAVAGGLFSFLALAQPLHAQTQQTLRGRVADAADDPVPGAVVLLHAITDAGGTELARDTADAAGSFELSAEFADGPLYFVATRLEGDIFVGEPFRRPPASEIVLRAGAGVEPLPLDGATAVADGAAGSVDAGEDAAHDGWLVAVIAAMLVGGVAWLTHRSRARAPRARELLVEIARLDEARAAAADGADEPYRARRAELRARLIEALELDADADRH